MRLTILAFGTRGDVQPLLALGKALQAQGHQVCLVASSHFKPWIEQHGLEAAPASVDIQAVMMSEGGHDWVEQGTNQFRQMRVMKKLLNRHGLAMMNDAWQASAGTEVLVSSFTSDIYAVSIAEKLGIPHISTPLQPALVATRSGPATLNAPFPHRDSLVNYLFGKVLIEPAGWRLAGDLNNRFRQETLELPPQTRRDNWRGLRRMLVVQGFSRHVVPHPPDWPGNIHTSGYWFLDEDRSWQPPQALLDFIKGGEPPVYIGFGSMTGRDPQRLTGLIIEALGQTRRRAVLQTGWAGIGQMPLPETIFPLDNAPHNWLFPRMSAVVHHGGAGTTGESLRAGAPTLIIPHMAEQPFWGARVAALGVGPAPIPRPRLTASNLAAAIEQAAGDPDMSRRAADLGARIRAEDGIGAAVAIIEAYLCRKPTDSDHANPMSEGYN